MMKSLRSKLILLVFAVSFVTVSLLTAVNARTFRRLIEHNTRETVLHNLRITMDAIDRNMELVGVMLDWFTLNSEVNAFFNATNRFPDDRRFKAMSAYNVVRNTIYTNGLSWYINKIILGNGTEDPIQFGIVNGHGTDWNRALEDLGESTGELIPGPFEWSEEELVYPIQLVVVDADSKEVSGRIFVTLNTEVVTRYTNEDRLTEGNRMMIGIGSQVYSIVDSRLVPMDTVSIEQLTNAIDKTGVADPGERPVVPSVETDMNGESRTLVVYRGPTTGWVMAQTVPRRSLAWQKNVLLRLTVMIILLMLAMAAAVAVIVDRTVNRPIQTLQERIQRISDGDFETDPDIEFENEIGAIGRGINSMVAEIDQLIHSRIRDEKTKKDLEFRVLQTQINPHFLYNTLNSIKWMATIQKAEGIAEIVSSLAVLLKHLAEGTGELISLEKEMSLVSEYCTIQQFRSGGMINTDMRLEEPELAQAQIVKFTLQPLVENAIVHGIEPKRVSGTVAIKAHRRKDLLIIEVTDDGVGIPRDKIESVYDHHLKQKKSMNHIGLKNVDERIKLRFGDEYGLSIASDLGHWTTVTVSLPLIFTEDNHRGKDGIPE